MHREADQQRRTLPAARDDCSLKQRPDLWISARDLVRYNTPVRCSKASLEVSDLLRMAEDSTVYTVTDLLTPPVAAGYRASQRTPSLAPSAARSTLDRSTMAGPVWISAAGAKPCIRCSH